MNSPQHYLTSTIKGIDCHIGSQITTLEPFKDALLKVLELIEQLKQLEITFEHIDLGGGLGINYEGEEPPDEERIYSDQ